MAAWGGNHFSPLLLLYREVDGYSAVQVNLFFAFYVLGLIPGFLVAGPLSDRHGRKRLVVAALALGVAGSVVLAFGSASVLWMCAGRLISGVSVAVAMVVGTSWIKELSQHDADPPTRARRASLTLTAGFGAGPELPGRSPSGARRRPFFRTWCTSCCPSAAAVPLLRAPETRTGEAGHRKSLLADLRIPAAGRRRFLGLVLPLAPWVFSAPALAFVVAPALVADRTGTQRIAFAALLAVITLVSGAAVQPFVPRIARRTGGRQAVVGLVAAAVATAVLAVDAVLLSPELAAVTAGLFGIAYGICIVSGLVEVQAMADPDSLAGLTGIYYSLTYVGFALPVVLAELARVAPYEILLSGVTVVCLACAAVVARTIRRGQRPDELR